MEKKGFTLIELVVGLTIFATVMTLSIGGIISIGKLERLSKSIINVGQNKIMISEYITRYVRQASSIDLDGGGLIAKVGQDGDLCMVKIYPSGQNLYLSIDDAGGCSYKTDTPSQLNAEGINVTSFNISRNNETGLYMVDFKLSTASVAVTSYHTEVESRGK